MNPETTNIILGPPGTGKTTRLIKIIEDFLNAGVKPDEICFLTFSRKAADVAQQRMMEKFNLTPDQLPYFRTLHSLAFRQLNLDKKRVMNFGDLMRVAQLIGISISFRKLEDGTFAGFEKGDRLMFMENLARVNGRTMEEHYNMVPHDEFELKELVQLHETLKTYKETNDKLDFTDMILEFLAKRPVPKIRKLVVDEAQDLAACQWSMVKTIAAHAEETYIAGDDDQAIFRWAGADIDTFINLPGKTEVLGQSYRVPQKIADLANEVVSRIGHRRDKPWIPRPENGEIHRVHGVDMIDMSTGTWLLLVRNAYMLKRYEEYCILQGYIFSSPTVDMLRGPSFEAVRIWERLRAGKAQMVMDIVKVYDFMNVKERVSYGFKGRLKALPSNQMLMMTDLRQNYGLRTESIWHEALDRISVEDREYFLAALRRGEKINEEPRIKMSTIHGAKGGEAENVVVLPDMAGRTFEEYQNNPDDEARVWYVAITRASKALWIVTSYANRFYPLS